MGPRSSESCGESARLEASLILGTTPMSSAVLVRNVLCPSKTTHRGQFDVGLQVLFGLRVRHN